MANPVAVGQLLETHPFFAEMSAESRRIIAGCAMNVRYDAGDYIGREGAPADQFYLIRHGQVALEIHVPGRQALIVDTLQEGEILGVSWLIPPYKWQLDARAVYLTRLLSLDAKCLREKMEDDHSLGFDLMRRFLPVIADRLQMARLRIIDMFGQPSSQTRA